MVIQAYVDQASPIVPSVFPSQIPGLVHWREPTLDSMYQDRAGASTPVVAATQPVGLHIDKSAPYYESEDLVNESAIWSGSSNPVTISGRVCHVPYAHTGYPGLAVPLIRAPRPGWIEVDFEVIAGPDHGGSAMAARLNTVNPSFGYSTIGRQAIVSPKSASSNISFTIYTHFSGTVILHSVREISGGHARQVTITARPRFAENPSRIEFDGVDDALIATFPDLGANCTIVRAIPGEGVQVLTDQTISGDWIDDVTSCGVLIYSRKLTTREIARVTTYMNWRFTQ